LPCLPKCPRHDLAHRLRPSPRSRHPLEFQLCRQSTKKNRASSWYLRTVLAMIRDDQPASRASRGPRRREISWRCPSLQSRLMFSTSRAGSRPLA
jgi:hypothetical protein